ncbi:hypothetical protein ACIBG0_13935 [Nocardia sp. NPDC050630]|uniref:hypothetical protein n=1 Tax=Nocardia sp. NPDC050630 TaxID=3364321 RepID=UPI0037A82370
MQTSLDRRDLWSTQHRDCSAEPMDLDLDLARFICSTHAGHGPDCHQYLAASAYCFARVEDN